MKLLIVTQVVDTKDPVLGFFHEWIEEFAKQCDSVMVICLRKGEYHLPENVRVFSLGKEKGSSRLARIKKFFSYIYTYRNNYDTVFVHMNPEYIALGGFLWRRWHKKIALWYTHKSVDAKLRFAMRFVDIVFTASRASFRVTSGNVAVVGHGIDTEFFKPDMKEGSIETRIVTTGRIARSKHQIEMLSVLDELYKRDEKFRFTIVGAPSTPTEEEYAAILRHEINLRPYHDKVTLVGPVPHNQLPKILNEQDIFFNFSTTGSMDKAVLEALAVGVPVLSTNEAFKDLLSPFDLYVASKDIGVLADRVDKIMNRPDRAGVVATLRNKVVEHHSLFKLIPRIVSTLHS